MAKVPKTVQRAEDFYRVSGGKVHCNADARPCVILKLNKDATLEAARSLAHQLELSNHIVEGGYGALRDAERDGHWLLNERRSSGGNRKISRDEIIDELLKSMDIPLKKLKLIETLR